MTYYYSCRIMSWNDADPDDTMIYAHSSHCIPLRFDILPTEPIEMDELLEYAMELMHEIEEHRDHSLLFSITGGDQGVYSTDPYRLLWQSEVTNNPGQTKGQLLQAIKETHARIDC